MNKLERANAKMKEIRHSHSRSAFLEILEFGYPAIDTKGNTEIFVNGKSFSQIMHDAFRPSLHNLLADIHANDHILNDTLNDTLNKNTNNTNDTQQLFQEVNHTKNIYQQHLEWYSSKPIPYLLENELNINTKEIVSTKLIYHSKLQHFILITIKQCKKRKFCLNIYERDAKPFLWKYAFDKKYLYQQHNKHPNKNDKTKSDKNSKNTNKTKEKKASKYEDKKGKLLTYLQDLKIIEFIQAAWDLVMDDLKSIGLDLSLGYNSPEELREILQEIILRESTQNPSFGVK